jgi:pSer/pThr/pTyr-binding forkhead associated (FHA) protein
MTSPPNQTSVTTDPVLPIPGELVVRNGRMRGVRRPVGVPVTLIGQAEVCDIRLNIAGIEPIQCLVIQGPAGFVLRDLGGGAVTLVNGEVASTQVLQHGDEIAIGPFQFTFERVAEVQDQDPQSLRCVRDALRIQAAAVVAQQAELIEKELQLEQRRLALESQEEQLAGHLEERQKRLVQMQAETREEREAFQAEQCRGRQELAESKQEMAQVREETYQIRKQADRERRRLVELRKRLKRRWKRHWQEKEEALGRQAEELARDRARQTREREALVQERLRFNGERELQHRQLQEEWQELGLAQQQWEVCLNQERTEQARRLDEVEARRRVLAEAEQAFHRERRNWEREQEARTRESEGLETRVANLRARLKEQEQVLAGQMAGSPGLPPAWEHSSDTVRAEETCCTPVAVEGAGQVHQLLGELADHRQRLLEQWERLLRLHAEWEHDRSAAIRDFETLAAHLQGREEGVEGQEKEVQQRLCQAEEKLRVFTRLQVAVEGQRARLTSQEATWSEERNRQEAELRLRESLLATQAGELEEVYTQRLAERNEEFFLLQKTRAALEAMRQDYIILWQKCQDTASLQESKQRELDAEALALAQCRQELLSRSADSPGSERRIERLRKRIAAQLARESHLLTRWRKHIKAETLRLEERAEHLAHQEALLEQQHTTAVWAGSGQAEWPRVREEGESQELTLLRSRCEGYKNQVATLQAEVERLAALLIEEGEILSTGPSRAA